MKEDLNLLRRMASQLIDAIDNIAKKYDNSDVNTIPTLDQYLDMHYDYLGSFPGYIKLKEELIKEYEEKYGTDNVIGKGQK